MILDIKNLSVHFGGIKALKGVTFGVEEGQVKAVIGPNGAGKTTLFNLITGIFCPAAGTITFQGRDIEGLKPHRIASLGISRTFQNVELFGNMTVLENIMVGRHTRSRAGFLRSSIRFPLTITEEGAIRKAAEHYLDFVGLTPSAHELSISLPLGQQRFLEIARALASEPKLLLLDEPAAGLDEKETDDLSRLIQQIRERDITVLLVEHDMNLTMEISDEIVVLNYGEVISEGVPRKIQYDKRVIEAYLGEDIGA
jgi:branched-chain amino acid transport system ATP-binding protein